MPTHPEKVLDWYKKHVYWDPTVPKPERIELLHQYNVNKKKTRRANGKNTHTLSPQPSTRKVLPANKVSTALTI